jgi:hypothetical protein
MQALSVAENAAITCEWFHRFEAEGAFNSCFNFLPILLRSLALH